MVPRLVHKIEGGYPERDIGAEEEEGQGWGDSRRLMRRKCCLSKKKNLLINQNMILIYQIEDVKLTSLSDLNQVRITYLSELPVEEHKIRLTIPTTVAPR